MDLVERESDLGALAELLDGLGRRPLPGGADRGTRRDRQPRLGQRQRLDLVSKTEITYSISFTRLKE
jgi:hypothetical protein